MKIAYCLNSIQEIGGISSVTVNKANALALKGHEVFVIVTDHEGEKGDKLLKKVHLIDLEIKYYKDDWKSKFHVIKGIIIKRRIHKIKLSKILKEISPDIVISVGQSEKYLLPEIKGNWKKIREFHYDKFYRLRAANNVLQKIGAHLINIYDFNLKIKKYDKVIVLTKEDKYTNWGKNKNVINIPNPITVLSSNLSTLSSGKFVAVGRLVDQKNFKSLIEAFRIALKSYPNWILEIYGEGILKDELQKQIITNKLSKNIFIRGNSLDHNAIYGNASAFVMTSIYEGFPLVLLEAMAYGLPVIAYECPCGPKDIIVDGFNGYLVPVNNELLMAKKIIQLMGNNDLRKIMGLNAKLKSEDYRIDNIIKQWLDLFYNLL
ncbi:MAG: glycosyltransferase family 4 protein [Erysipelotrichales bacterium]|nr:glycosyltransferase family 4 protein [Erysipelotrichales bacterium]